MIKKVWEWLKDVFHEECPNCGYYCTNRYASCRPPDLYYEIMEDKRNMKKTVCIDFDGVIHSYTSGWKGADVVSDEPVPGAFEAIKHYLINGFDVCIFSSRSNQEGGIDAMKAWMVDFHLDPGPLRFPTEKPPAILYIDDRAYHFTGEFPSPNFINTFQPWNKP